MNNFFNQSKMSWFGTNRFDPWNNSPYRIMNMRVNLKPAIEMPKKSPYLTFAWKSPEHELFVKRMLFI